MMHVTFASAYKQLRPSERQFVDAYVRNLEDEADKTQTRISVLLYRPVPPETVEASRGMLELPMVIAAISERVTEIAMQSELTVQKVIRELRAIAFSSLGHYQTIGEDGYPYHDMTKCTPEQISAIKKFKLKHLPRGGTELEIETHDKLRAMEMLGKYMGIFETDNPHWRADSARSINPAALNGASAADSYARMING